MTAREDVPLGGSQPGPQMQELIWELSVFSTDQVLGAISLRGTGSEGQGAGMQPEGRDDIYGRRRRGEDRWGQEGPGS